MARFGGGIAGRPNFGFGLSDGGADVVGEVVWVARTLIESRRTRYCMGARHGHVSFAPHPRPGAAMMPPTYGRLLGFAAASLLWLPAGIVALTLVRGFGLPPETDSWLLLAVTAPCGLPLALAWLALRSAGWRRIAWTVFAVLGPLSVLGALAGGLLGPVGIAGYTAVLSLPAWIVYAVCRLRRT